MTEYFISYSPPENLHSKIRSQIRFSCRFSCPVESHQRCPCIHPCPRVLPCRCSVGELTDEQVEEFEKMSRINDLDYFYLGSSDKLGIKESGKSDHLSMKRNFDRGFKALRKRLRDHYGQDGSNVSEREPTYIVSNSSITNDSLIQYVSHSNNWRIPAPFREIISEFRHIILMCQFMIDAERVRNLFTK